MKPIEYNIKQIYPETKGDSTNSTRGIYDEKSQVFQKKHFGLIAQDLQKIYPDLVYQNDSGYLSVNYIGLIPILIQSIKELNTELEALKAKTDGYPSAEKAKSDSRTNETELLTYPVLDQNIPIHSIQLPLLVFIYYCHCCCQYLCLRHERLAIENLLGKRKRKNPM
jgi:hypothetical protein